MTDTTPPPGTAIADWPACWTSKPAIPEWLRGAPPPPPEPEKKEDDPELYHFGCYAGGPPWWLNKDFKI